MPKWTALTGIAGLLCVSISQCDCQLTGRHYRTMAIDTDQHGIRVSISNGNELPSIGRALGGSSACAEPGRPDGYLGCLYAWHVNIDDMMATLNPALACCADHRCQHLLYLPARYGQLSALTTLSATRTAGCACTTTGCTNRSTIVRNVFHKIMWPSAGWQRIAYTIHTYDYSEEIHSAAVTRCHRLSRSRSSKTHGGAGHSPGQKPALVVIPGLTTLDLKLAGCWVLKKMQMAAGPKPGKVDRTAGRGNQPAGADQSGFCRLSGQPGQELSAHLHQRRGAGRAGGYRRGRAGQADPRAFCESGIGAVE